MLREFVTLQAGRFDTSEREHHVNPCCRGEDFARWLHGKLAPVLPEPPKGLYHEDFGWVIDCPLEGSADVVMVTVVFFEPDEQHAHPLLCASVDVRVSTATSLFRKARKAKLLERKDETIRRIDSILQQEQDFQDVQWWHEGPVCGAPAAHPDA